MEALWNDLRYAVRMLVKTPGFTIIAVITLALGIGANTAIFSIVNAVLLRALPYSNPENLVQISNTFLPAWPKLGLSPGDFQDWKKQAHNFSEMAAYVDVATDGFNLTGEGEPERVKVAYATSNLFPMLGIRPVAGRTFAPSDDKPGSAPEVLLSHRLWQNHFGSDAAVVGRTIQLDGNGYTLAGVLPGNFKLSSDADLWMPVGQYADDLTGRLHHPYNVIARLKPGIALAQAQADMATLNQQEELSFPDTHKGWGVLVQRMETASAGKLRLALLVLFGVVGFVLLIGCVNIVNLLLARNAARQKEIALRIALGASHARLICQLLTESTLLSVVGGVLGMLLAIAGLRMLRAFVPADLAGVQDASLNGGVLAFTVLICFLAGVICGLVPAFQILKSDMNGILKEGKRGSGGQKLRSLLVVSEIALALIPLVGAGLLIRSFHRLLEVYPGFAPDHVLTMQVPLPAISPADLNKMTPQQQNDLTRKQSLEFEQLSERIENLPGVKHVGGIDVLPLASATIQATRFVVEGQAIPSTGTRPVAEFRVASLQYFSTMEIALIRGRLFTADDWGEPNIVVNKTMAQRFWPGMDPIGKRINICSFAPQPCWYPIVGVVGDVHEYGLDAAPTFDVYTAGGWTPNLVIRTAADPSAIAHAAIEEVHKIDPNLPVTHVLTLDSLLSDSNSYRRFSTMLLGLFAVLALVLAAVGIYGVMSYVVGLRTNEIGIRMALGAQRRDIWSLIVGRGIKLAIAGVAIGLAGAFALSRLLSSLLYSVQSSDPTTFLGVALLLVAVALVACYFPARRAMRVDPMIALRYE
jgi:putative ABC transport system permease protein